MTKKSPYPLSYLLDYVENKLSTEEDIELAKVIRKNEHLRLIVEGIEAYQESELTISLEAYLQQNKRAVWAKFSTYLSGKTPRLSASEKSFYAWVVEKKLPLYALIFSALYGLGLMLLSRIDPIDVSSSLKPMSYIFQALALIMTGLFFFNIKPPINGSIKHHRALLGRRQMWSILVKLTFSWIVLYSVLSFFSFGGNDYSVLLFNGVNNLTIIYLYLCYHCLNNNSIDLKAEWKEKDTAAQIRAAIQKPIQTKERWGWGLVILAFVIEFALVSNFPESKRDFHLMFGILSGLVCMAFTARLVSRIGSKFLSKEKLIIICLSFYAGIQPLLVFIFPDESYSLFTGPYSEQLAVIISLGLVLYALFGKILLLTFVAWSLESNRIINYFKKTKELDDQNEEKELLKIKEDLAFSPQDSAE